jgi:hypothetical protein
MIQSFYVPQQTRQILQSILFATICLCVGGLPGELLHYLPSINHPLFLWDFLHFGPLLFPEFELLVLFFLRQVRVYEDPFSFGAIPASAR